MLFLEKVWYENTMITIKNKQMFKDHLKEKYGRGIFSDLERLSKDFNLTLNWLGNKYGFTREYARQVFFRYYGYKYSRKVHEGIRIKAKEQEKQKLQNFYVLYDPVKRIRNIKKSGPCYKGLIVEVEAKKICERLGYKIIIDPQKSLREIDLIVNNYFCEIKSSYVSYQYYKNTPTRYFRCRLSEKQKETAHFLIWYIAPQDEFYIMPSHAYFKYCNTLFLPEGASNNKFSEYKNAWHLLRVGSDC